MAYRALDGLLRRMACPSPQPSPTRRLTPAFPQAGSSFIAPYASMLALIWITEACALSASYGCDRFGHSHTQPPTRGRAVHRSLR